jgi:membrane-associated protein
MRLAFAEPGKNATLHPGQEQAWRERMPAHRWERNMIHLPTRWKESALRLAALALLVWAFAGLALHPAAAQEGGAVLVPAEPGADSPSFFWQVLTNLFNSRALMATLSQPEFTVLAFIALNVIVFVETGLLIGFCLPGDSLLVTAGLIASNPACSWNLPLLLVTLCAAAILGDSLGYTIGFQTGPKIFTREKSFFFKKDHLLKAKDFYERHGPITIVLARFIPVLRTFAPVVAGVGQMEYRRFVAYNVFGGIGWVVSMVLLGYYLPGAVNPLFQWLLDRPDFLVQDHIEKIVILIVLLSVSPYGVAWLRSKISKPAARPELVETVK